MTSDTGLDRLRAEARRAMGNAYAPYSGFRVGAAVETQDGRVFAGCNVENASYPVTMCAERTAIGAAIAAGAQALRRVFVCSSSHRPVAPCGMCRQALAEFEPQHPRVDEDRLKTLDLAGTPLARPGEDGLRAAIARARGEPD